MASGEPHAASQRAERSGSLRRLYARSGLLLAVTGVSLYLLLPSLVGVFSSWRSLSHLNWYWTGVALLSEAASFICLWELDRISLHARPIDHLVRPLASALNGPSLVRLVRSGMDTVLLDANFMPSPPGLHETASPIVRLASGSAELTGVLPDPGVAAVAASYQADPVLDAHASLGELAATWLELPGTAGDG